MLGARVKQARPLRIFSHRVNAVIRANAVYDLRPALAVVSSLKDVRRSVVQLITLRCKISRSRFVRRSLDQAYAAELGETRWRYFLPLLSAVARDVCQPVIRAGPYRVCFQTRRRDREDRSVDFRSVLIFGDRPARISKRLGISARQIGADALPTLAVVGGLPKVL